MWEAARQRVADDGGQRQRLRIRTSKTYPSGSFDVFDLSPQRTLPRLHGKGARRSFRNWIGLRIAAYIKGIGGPGIESTPKSRMPNRQAFPNAHHRRPDNRAESRRDFLKKLAILGVSTLVSAESVPALVGAPAHSRIVDVHHHFMPPEYLKFAQAHGQAVAGKIPRAFSDWTLDEDLDDMDKTGISTAILSVTTPGFWFGEREEVRTVIRKCNEFAAMLSGDHPGRFGSFAAIPLTDTEGALGETAYALDALKADGIAIFSNYGDRWLGHESFRPVYEELNRRKAVVFVHPIEGNCCRDLVPGVGTALIEYGTDTTRTIASLIFSGITTKYSDIIWIFSHAGGTMPFLIERFLVGSAGEIVPGIVTKGQGGTGVVGSNPPAGAPQGSLHEIRRMYYDTAQTANPVAMRALRSVVPVSQIVFGTDFWFRTAEETERGLVTSKVFTPDELRAINRENIARILPPFHYGT
jgi:6-methylsalicylate decarboxylase